MRSNLLADLVIRQRFLELIEAGDKYIFARRQAKLFLFLRAKLHPITKKSQNIIEHTIMLLEVEIQRVAEDLGPSVGEQVLGDKYDEGILLLSAACKMLVGLFVVGEEDLAEERHDHCVGATKK